MSLGWTLVLSWLAFIGCGDAVILYAQTESYRIWKRRMIYMFVFFAPEGLIDREIQRAVRSQIMGAMLMALEQRGRNF